MKKLVIALIVAVVFLGGTPVFAYTASGNHHGHHQAIFTEEYKASIIPHNTAGGKIEVRNLEVIPEKIFNFKTPRWFAIDWEISKDVAQNIGFDSFKYIEDDRGISTYLTCVFDLNPGK